jgi:hypothetical protein
MIDNFLQIFSCRSNIENRLPIYIYVCIYNRIYIHEIQQITACTHFYKLSRSGKPPPPPLSRGLIVAFHYRITIIWLASPPVLLNVCIYIYSGAVGGRRGRGGSWLLPDWWRAGKDPAPGAPGVVIPHPPPLPLYGTELVLFSRKMHTHTAIFAQLWMGEFAPFSYAYSVRD